MSNCVCASIDRVASFVVMLLALWTEFRVSWADNQRQKANIVRDVTTPPAKHDMTGHKAAYMMYLLWSVINSAPGNYISASIRPCPAVNTNTILMQLLCIMAALAAVIISPKVCCQTVCHY